MSRTLLENEWGPVVETDDEQIAPFRLDLGELEPEGKATAVEVLDDGDLIIEGWAANFEGVDREGENFAPGAFKNGIKSFLDGQAALCFHHKPDHGIGSVLDLQEVEGKGLWMKARVDHQEKTSPLRYIYDAVRKESYKGLSVGGFFKRARSAAGQFITDMDFTEISVTPVAIHPRTQLSVVAGKAFEGVTVPTIEEDIRDEDQWQLEHAVSTIKRILEQLDRRGEGQREETEGPLESAVTP